LQAYEVTQEPFARGPEQTLWHPYTNGLHD
jgi:hypothetical protein